MDLISITQTVWRHKLVTIPVVIFMALAAVYVLKIEPPTYKASGSILIVNPPTAATPAQIAAQPSLKGASNNNPYVNLGNLPAVAEVVINLVTSDPIAQQLTAEGLNSQSTIQLGADFAGSTPILEIAGVGSTPQAAITSADLLARASINALHQIQVGQSVNPFYMIKGITLTQAHQAQIVVSGRLRTLIGLLAAGVILLFVALSLAEAMEKRKISLRPRGRRRSDADGTQQDAFDMDDRRYPETDRDYAGEIGPNPNMYRQPPQLDYDGNRGHSEGGYNEGGRPDYNPRIGSY